MGETNRGESLAVVVTFIIVSLRLFFGSGGGTNFPKQLMPFVEPVRFSVALWIKQHHFDSRKSLPHGVAKFLGIEVRQMSIEKQHLPKATFQMGQRVRSSTSLLKTADGRTQAFKNALAHDDAGTGHQDVVGIVREDRRLDWIGRHSIDLK